MKKLLLGLALLVLVVVGAVLVLGQTLLKDPGYVLIVHGNTEVTTSVSFLVLCVFLAALVLVLLTLIAVPLWRLLTPASWGPWRRRRAGLKSMREGLMHLAEGNWRDAEDRLEHAANHSEWPLPALLGATVAARQRGDGHAERYWLRAAAEYPRGELPAALLAARFALNDGVPARAREHLQAMRSRYGDSTVLLTMLMEACTREGDWAALCDLIPQLRRLHPTPQLDLRERRAWQSRMRQTANSPSYDNNEARRNALTRLWKKMPQPLHREPVLCAQYAGYLAQFGDGEAALKRIVTALSHQWDDGLPAVLEAINDISPDRLLAQIEEWLQAHPRHPVVLLTGGRIALKAQLWGQARRYFEQGAAAGSVSARAELVRLLEALGEGDAVPESYRQALLVEGHALPVLPLPRRRALPSAE
ncbi:heme biosynthesis HemY N-terminal domain-containing protein [Isoalcanivorax beigongshangi]|uniref:Heme biosynthesis HemY N-terminal domain-containing protein n=1 Tax=Isoalcanivorax beigongshangi TaxID=3238810 RepID=A0ABV4ADK8_9GAMM